MNFIKNRVNKRWDRIFIKLKKDGILHFKIPIINREFKEIKINDKNKFIKHQKEDALLQTFVSFILTIGIILGDLDLLLKIILSIASLLWFFYSKYDYECLSNYKVSA